MRNGMLALAGGRLGVEAPHAEQIAVLASVHKVDDTVGSRVADRLIVLGECPIYTAEHYRCTTVAAKRPRPK
jgi:hypothetical protein